MSSPQAGDGKPRGGLGSALGTPARPLLDTASKPLTEAELRTMSEADLKTAAKMLARAGVKLGMGAYTSDAVTALHLSPRIASSARAAAARVRKSPNRKAGARTPKRGRTKAGTAAKGSPATASPSQPPQAKRGADAAATTTTSATAATSKSHPRMSVISTPILELSDASAGAARGGASHSASYGAISAVTAPVLRRGMGARTPKRLPTTPMPLLKVMEQAAIEENKRLCSKLTWEGDVVVHVKPLHSMLSVMYLASKKG